MFRCSTLFGLPKEDTTRNQLLSYIYNTVPQQFNPNIKVCPAHFTESSQVTFIYIALITIQIVSKQQHNIKIGK